MCIYIWRPTGPRRLVSQSMCLTFIRNRLRRIMHLNDTLRNSIQRMFAQHFFGWSGFVSCKVAMIVLTFYVFTLFICYACVSGFGDLD